MSLPKWNPQIKFLLIFIVTFSLVLFGSDFLLVNFLQSQSHYVIMISTLVTATLVTGISFWLSHPLSELEKIEQQRKRMEKSAQLLVRRDLDLREINEELEKEKQAISGERNKLAIILYGITDAVIALDLNRRVIIFNKSAQNLTGYSEKEIVGKPLTDFIKIYDKEREVSLDEYCPVKRDGFEGTIFNKPSLKLISKNQKVNFINLITGQIAEGLSTNLGAILTLHDVTYEKELEEMKLDFVTMAAHELRTPLTSIRDYLSVFIQENLSKFSNEQKMFLNRISISTQQLMSLVENLLSVSRVERGVFTINREPADWISIVRQVTADLNTRAVERKLKLTLFVPNKPLPKVLADKLRIGEVVSNLVSNAITYTPAGGKINVWLEQLGDFIITHVQDTGEGIPKEALPHLFTKFFRVSGKLEQGSKGTGLGLYISKSIIDMHQGRIWVESELGKGSTFSFSLPITKPTQTSA